MKIFNQTSSSHQDVFAYQVCGAKGVYLEIGGNDAYKSNNTHALEKYHDWKGITLELNKNKHINSWQSRTNKIVWDDALTVDYEALLTTNGFSPTIDYLQVDIEPAKNTFNVLENILKTNIDFKCCTFEHDNYARKDSDPDYKQLADELMFNKGYKIAVENVLSRKNKKYYETWYVKNNIDWTPLDWTDWQEEIKTWAGFV